MFQNRSRKLEIRTLCKYCRGRNILQIAVVSCYLYCVESFRRTIIFVVEIMIMDLDSRTSKMGIEWGRILNAKFYFLGVVTNVDGYPRQYHDSAPTKLP